MIFSATKASPIQNNIDPSRFNHIERIIQNINLFRELKTTD